MLLAVFIAWVPFRAPDLDTTLRIWAGMFSGPLLSQPFEAFLPDSVMRLLDDIGLAPAGPPAITLGDLAVCLPLAGAALLLSLWLPNGRALLPLILPEPTGSEVSGAAYPRAAGAALAVLFVGSLVYLSHNTVFLYFQF